MADQVRIVIPGKPEYTTMIRLAIGSAATEAGFSVEDVEDIKVATSEACKNICCHGNDAYASKIEIECNVERGKIEIKVIDQSEGESLEKVNKPCMDCPKEGDLGLYIINSIMNEVKVSSHAQGQKSITMVKVNE